MLESHQQRLRPDCQNHMHSILESIRSVEEDFESLVSKASNTRLLGLHSPSSFEEEL